MTDNELRVSEAQIAVHWQEENKFSPHQGLIAQANMTDPEIFQRFSLENFPDCYKEYADLLDWDRYWNTLLDTSDALSSENYLTYDRLEVLGKRLGLRWRTVEPWYGLRWAIRPWIARSTRAGPIRDH